MKFKNKKTGEIIETGNSFLHFQGEYFYTSLAELNEEWEDYEEPKEWYYINISGVVKQGEDNVPTHLIEGMEQIGNYFDTREQAEQAVEKLKAWKRLKDRGVRIVGWDYSDNVDLNGCKFIDDDFIVGLSAGDIDEEDLDLLFGGEE